MPVVFFVCDKLKIDKIAGCDAMSGHGRVRDTGPRNELNVRRPNPKLARVVYVYSIWHFAL